MQKEGVTNNKYLSNMQIFVKTLTGKIWGGGGSFDV